MSKYENANNNHVTLLADGTDVLFVPSLSHSLFSVKKHQEQQGHYCHFEINEVNLAFPTFIYSNKILNKPKFTAISINKK